MTVELKVPEVGESITEVVIGEWLKSEGDALETDEPVVELESEKATVELPSPSGGRLTEILKQPGDTAEVGEVIGYIDEQAEAEAGDSKAKKSKSEGKKKSPQTAKPGTSESRQRTREPAAGDDGGETRVMPAAARVLAEHGLEAEQVPATGPGGRLLKEDVQRYVEKRQAKKQPDERRAAPSGDRSEEVRRLSPIRRRIAQRLVEAQQSAALLTTFNEIDMTEVKALRKRHQDAFVERHGVKLGFMSFFVQAAVDALQQFPAINAEIQGDNAIYRAYCDVGIAIGGGKGLIVPVLRNAERMSCAEIELAIADLAERAQTGKISPDELQGGTFTISNGGVYGSLLSTPIVNPPQSGVLGMHAIEDRAVVRGGEIVVRPMMYVALTYDHRIVDGREAVTFLRRIKQCVEEPARLLIDV